MCEGEYPGNILYHLVLRAFLLAQNYLAVSLFFVVHSAVLFPAPEHLTRFLCKQQTVAHVLRHSEWHRGLNSSGETDLGTNDELHVSPTQACQIIIVVEEALLPSGEKRKLNC